MKTLSAGGMKRPPRKTCANYKVIGIKKLRPILRWGDFDARLVLVYNWAMARGPGRVCEFVSGGNPALKGWTMARQTLFSFMLIVMMAPGIWADEVEVRNGVLDGKILSNLPDAIVFKTLAGDEITINRKTILAIAHETEVQYLLDRGNHLEDRGKDEDAYLEYIEVLKQDPKNEEANRRMEEINLRHRRERWQKGIDEARKLVNEEKYRKGLRVYQAILADQPEDSVAEQIVEEMCNTYAQLAFMYYNHCYEEGAMRELAKAEELNPNSAEIYYLLGRIHETGGHLSLARQEYERALEMDANHFQARERLAEIIEKMRSPLWRYRQRG